MPPYKQLSYPPNLPLNLIEDPSRTKAAGADSLVCRRKDKLLCWISSGHNFPGFKLLNCRVGDSPEAPAHCTELPANAITRDPENPRCGQPRKVSPPHPPPPTKDI